MDNENLALRREQLKALWKRPEGVMGILTGIGVFAGIGYGIFKLLPYLITMASNMIILAAEIIALIVLIYGVLLNGDFWRNLSLIWYQLNRKILGLIVDMDPISVLRRGIEEMEKNLSLVTKKITELEGIIVEMEKKLVEYKGDFETDTIKLKALKKKMAAKKDSMSQQEQMKYNSELILLSKNIDRLGETIKRQQDRIKTSKKYQDIMKKLEIVAKFKVEDSRAELRTKQEEFAQAKAQSSAMKSIQTILKGGLGDSLEKELAMNSINETVNESVAEMRRLLDGSNDLLVDFEINSEVSIHKAEQLLQQFDEGGFHIFDTPTDEDSYEAKANMKKAISGRKRKPVLVEVEDAEVVEENTNPKYF